LTGHQPGLLGKKMMELGAKFYPLPLKSNSVKEYERALTMSEGRRLQFLAGRFAAKEAIIKCLSDHEVPEMCNLNIINNEKGKPEIRYKDYRILISISHERKFAVATAILEEEGL
ncbi:MAG: 4'-phosphopantetheinyl transferase superfamily protein, partial [Erysipelotrichaceae bacterium]|nr:4'-phosphopantetheinyl transferase superfamily protein [Erysipelotrichaceae bacterium]